MPDRLVWNGKSRSFLLQADNRVTFIADTYEVAVVNPLLLEEFDRGHRLGADEQKNGAARYFISFFRHIVRIIWWPIRCAAPYEAMNVDIGQPSEICVTRVHAPDMASERSLPAARVIRVVKIIVPMRVRAECGVVYFRCQHERCAAAPTANQLRGE